MKKAYLKYILALLLFGSNGIVASLISLSSHEIVFLRTLIGSLLLILIFKLTGNKFDLPNNKSHLIFLAISGVAMGMSWMFLYAAYQQIGVSIASLAYYCGPVIVMAMAPLIFKEKLTLVKVAGFVAVLFGLLLINFQAFREGKTTQGIMFGILSAIMYAIMVIFNKKANSITGMKNSILQLTISFLTVAVFVGFKQGFNIAISKEDWLPIIILGLINTGIGCYLYFSSIGRLPVQTVAILGYLEPLSAVVLSIVFLHEKLLLFQMIGAILVIGGALYAEGLSNKK